MSHKLKIQRGSDGSMVNLVVMTFDTPLEDLTLSGVRKKLGYLMTGSDRFLNTDSFAYIKDEEATTKAKEAIATVMPKENAEAKTTTISKSFQVRLIMF